MQFIFSLKMSTFSVLRCVSLASRTFLQNVCESDKNTLLECNSSQDRSNSHSKVLPATETQCKTGNRFIFIFLSHDIPLVQAKNVYYELSSFEIFTNAQNIQYYHGCQFVFPCICSFLLYLIKLYHFYRPHTEYGHL